MARVRAKKARKAKRAGGDIVVYTRVKPIEHALLTQIAAARGYPHSFASVAAEMISRSLAIDVIAAELAKAPKVTS